LHDATEARQKTFEAIESERVQALTLLAASVAHEIGNPLNALHIHLQLMERQIRKLKALPVTPPVVGRRGARGVAPANEAAEIALKLEQYLDVAKGGINRLDYIITQFLQAMRPSPPQLQPSSLNEIVQKTLTLLGPELDDRGLVVSEKLSRQLPDAPLDPIQIQQVLVNLITTKTKGSGLGLMIVQRIVRAHGGRIELESNVGQGTTFRLWFPLHERPTRLLEAATAEPA
jgi:signal transduction histidine kinase